MDGNVVRRNIDRETKSYAVRKYGSEQNLKYLVVTSAAASASILANSRISPASAPEEDAIICDALLV